MAQDIATEEKSTQQDKEVIMKIEEMQSQLNALLKEVETLKKTGKGRLL